MNQYANIVSFENQKKAIRYEVRRLKKIFEHVVREGMLALKRLHDT